MKLKDIFKLKKCINCSNKHIHDFLCLKSNTIIWDNDSVYIYKQIDGNTICINITDVNSLKIRYVFSNYIIYSEFINYDFDSLDDIIKFIDNIYFKILNNLIFT